MGNRFEFKANVARLALYFLSMNALILIVFFLSCREFSIGTTLAILGFVNIYYLTEILSKPFKIIIDQDEFKLELHYLVSFLKKHRVVSLNEVQCRFDYETPVRTGKIQVLRITYKEKLIVKLLPHYNGWDKKDLSEIFRKLYSIISKL